MEDNNSKMMQKQLAVMLNMSPKALKQYVALNEAMSTIREKLGNDDLYDQFEKLAAETGKDRRSGLSFDLIFRLSRCGSNEVKTIITDVLNNRGNEKKVLRSHFTDMPVNTMIQLPGYIDGILSALARSEGTGKKRYFEKILTQHAQNNTTA